MHPVYTYLIASLAILLAPDMAFAVNPGLQMRVTKKGIDYANTVAQAALQQEVKTLKIPDQSGDDHHLQWSVHNIRTEGVSGPNSNIALNPGQNGLTWSLTNFYIELKADWRVKYKKGWAKVSTSGSVSVKFKDVSMTATVGFGDKDGRPTIAAKSCDAHIGGVDVHFHGGASFIWNLFSGILEDKFKKIIPDKLCEVATKEVNVDAQAALAKMKVTVEIGHRFLLDYGLITPPKITAEYLESQHKGEIYWLADKQECPFSPGTIPPWNDTSTMTQIWLTEYTANTFAYNAHNHDYLKYNVTKKDLKGNDTYLDTTCKTMCIGKLIPQLGKKYPNSSVEMRINSTKVPTVKITSESLLVSTWSDVALYAHTPDNQTVFLFTLNVSLAVTVQPAIENEKLIGTIAKHEFDVGVIKSDMGELDPRVLKIILGGALDLAVFPELNRLGKIGIDLPVTGDVKFLNTKLIMQEGALLVTTDVSYEKDSDVLRFSPEVHSQP